MAGGRSESGTELTLTKDVALNNLCDSFRELDGVFLRALKRAGRQRSIRIGVNDAWAAPIAVEQADIQEFTAKSQADPGEYLGALASLIVYWEMALEYMVLEDDGFPTREILVKCHSAPYPRPRLLDSGYSAPFQEVLSITEFLPLKIANLAQVGALVTANTVEDKIRRRVSLLDRFLGIAFHPKSAGHRRETIAVQIDRRWPKGVPRIAPYSSPVKVAQAFPTRTPNVNPTITIIICVASVLTCIPAGMSFVRAPNSKGSHHDADFCSLVQGSTMQIASLFTMMIPVYWNKQLAKQAWFYMWILAGFSLTASLFAMPLYLVSPVGWSSLVVAVNSIAQGFVTLLLIFTVAS